MQNSMRGVLTYAACPSQPCLAAFAPAPPVSQHWRAARQFSSAATLHVKSTLLRFAES